jgi:hypothetical protein
MNDSIRSIRHCAGCLAALFAFSVAPSAAAEVDVHRQLRQREQSQAELRLKMQQQAERAVQPRREPAAELERRVLERDQLRRLRQSHEQQSRADIPASAESETTQIQSEGQRQRAGQTAAEQLERFEAERRHEAERPRP